MPNKSGEQAIEIRKRYRHLAVAFAFASLATVVLLILNQDRGVAVVEQQQSVAVPGDVAVLVEAEPSRIQIPKLDIDAPFEEPLGLTNTKEIEVPEKYETVGYYKHGPTPGELGPAVVLGHVDSLDGPAIFYSLGQLEEGDEIFIDREDGSVAEFVVTKLERHEQSGFPTEQVYGNIDHAGLRLITCSGTFDRGVQRYSHNLIVFAELVEE